MTEMFLLGAGASVEAGIPDAFKMTEQMLERFSGDPRYERESKILRFTAGGLLFQQGIKGENPYDGVNIEDVFNAVDLLGKRQNSELGSFIGSWHPKLSELEGGKIGGSSANDMLKDISRSLDSNRAGSSFASSNFQRHFSNAIREFLVGSEGTVFTRTSEAMIRKLVELVWINNVNKIAYLIPLIRYAQRNSSTIVTLNYDNTIELAGRDSNTNVGTGFESWSETGEFAIKNGQVPLIKLHDSINWKLSVGQPSLEKPLPFQTIQIVNPDDKEPMVFRPAVIFGGKNKLTPRGPFLSLLRAFEKHLSETEQLTVIGYSFRDEHVNEFVANWLNGKTTRRIRILDKAINKRNEFIKSLELAQDRVQFIDKTIASKGIIDITQNL
jgi:hypothetical protein